MSLDAKQDAEHLHKALHFFGTDTKMIIDVIARRPNWHIQKVREEYEKLYQKDLLQQIISDTSFNFKKLLINLVKSRAENRAESLYTAMKGLGTDEWDLIDIIITSTNKEIEEFKQFFRQKYDTSLDQFVKGDTSFNFEKVLLHCLEAQREEGIKHDEIASDVEKIYKGGEAKWGTDDKLFVDIFTKRSHEHLEKVGEHYQKAHEHTLEHAINSETSGWYKCALQTCIQRPEIHWAKRMNQAIKGLGTNDRLLIRCFSECSKPFLQLIAKEYKQIYNVSLEDDIKGDTSGHYEELLLALLDFPESERQNY
jgi:hypothetical protein